MSSQTFFFVDGRHAISSQRKSLQPFTTWSLTHFAFIAVAAAPIDNYTQSNIILVSLTHSLARLPQNSIIIKKHFFSSFFRVMVEYFLWARKLLKCYVMREFLLALQRILRWFLTLIFKNFYGDFKIFLRI